MEIIGVVDSSFAFNNRSHASKSIKEIERVLRDQNIEVTQDILRQNVLDGSDEQIECYYWMDDLLNFSGDAMPNRATGGIAELHLESQSLNKLYAQYLSECVTHVSAKVWKFIWDNLFPHVKIREYKQVGGKCETCALLSDLRSQFKNAKLKQMATDLHTLHRNTYMGERWEYYDRRMEALNNPDEVMSIIADGMAQSHTSLPYYGNLNQNVATVKQKLQGVLDHGRQRLNLWLCMHSCPVDTNLALHTFYLTLEEWREEKGHYPSKVYWQIDGGPENANTYVLAFAEY